MFSTDIRLILCKIKLSMYDLLTRNLVWSWRAFEFNLKALLLGSVIVKSSQWFLFRCFRSPCVCSLMFVWKARLSTQSWWLTMTKRIINCAISPIRSIDESLSKTHFSVGLFINQLFIRRWKFYLKSLSSLLLFAQFRRS